MSGVGSPDGDYASDRPTGISDLVNGQTNPKAPPSIAIRDGGATDLGQVLEFSLGFVRLGPELYALPAAYRGESQLLVSFERPTSHSRSFWPIECPSTVDSR